MEEKTLKRLLDLYEEASAEDRTRLESMMGKKIFANLSKGASFEPHLYTYKDIRSYEDACRLLEENINPVATADEKLTTIYRAINAVSKFVPDFNNPTQKKFRPYFRMGASGFRFGGSDCDFSYSYSDVGSRLCHYVGTENEAKYIAEQFFELHKDHFFGR